MTVTVNGDTLAVAAATTVADVVRARAGLDDAHDAAGTAVAVNDAVVPRGAWASIVLSDGDRVEVLGAVAGG